MQAERTAGLFKRLLEQPPKKRQFGLGYPQIEFLKPPDDLIKTSKKAAGLWTRRGYGLWPAGILRDAQATDVLTYEQKDLLKSMLQNELILRDEAYFKEMGAESASQKAYGVCQRLVEMHLADRSIRLRHKFYGSSQADAEFDNMESQIFNLAATIASLSLRNRTQEFGAKEIEDHMLLKIRITLDKLQPKNRELLVPGFGEHILQ